MSARSHHRGHRMYYDEKSEMWKYEDDNTLVSECWKKRPCGECGKNFTKNGHDPCIASLPGVTNACCGHGVLSESYICFNNGLVIRGFKIETKNKSLDE